jgi:hypothetical protein
MRPRQHHIGVPTILELGDGIGVEFLALAWAGAMPENGLGAFFVDPEFVVGVMDVGRRYW